MTSGINYAAWNRLEGELERVRGDLEGDGCGLLECTVPTVTFTDGGNPGKPLTGSPINRLNSNDLSAKHRPRLFIQQQGSEILHRV
jgi:hypothetical protein